MPIIGYSLFLNLNLYQTCGVYYSRCISNKSVIFNIKFGVVSRPRWWRGSSGTRWWPCPFSMPCRSGMKWAGLSAERLGLKAGSGWVFMMELLLHGWIIGVDIIYGLLLIWFVILGVIAEKWNVTKKTKPEAAAMISSTSGEPNFEKREEIFTNLRDELTIGIRYFW